MTLRRLRRPATAVAALMCVTSLGIWSQPVLATDDAEVDVVAADVVSTVVPDPELTLSSDVTSTHPGDDVEYTAELSYEFAQLSVESTLTVENTGTETATIEYVSVVFESSPTGESGWEPFGAYALAADGWEVVDAAPSEGVGPISASALTSEASGVIYPIDVMPIVGTTIEDGATASFDLRASLRLNDATTLALLDDGEVDGIRQVVHVEVSPRASSQPFADTSDLTEDVQTSDTDLEDATIIIQPPSGSPVDFDSLDSAALALVVIGDASIPVGTIYDVPGDTAKGGGESDQEYLDRLRGYADLAASAEMSATVGTGEAATQAATTVTMELPILAATESSGQSGVVGGQTLESTLQLTNVGRASTDDISVSASLPDDVDAVVSGAAEVVDPGQGDSSDLSYDVPDTYAEGVVSTSVEVTWTDADAYEYGPVSASMDVWVSNGEPGAPSAEAGGKGDPVPAFGTETIQGLADDETEVTDVELLIDGDVVDSDSSYPYEFEWDTTLEDDGAHTYQIRAHDGDDHVTTSAPQPVHVDNALPSDLRIQADSQLGRLGLDDATLYRVQAAIDPGVLPARYQSTSAPAVYGTEAFMNALADWGSLDPGTQDNIVDFLDGLDDDLSGWATDDTLLGQIGDFAGACSDTDACAFVTDHFTIHYAVDPDTDRAVDMDDDIELTEGNRLEDDCGTCDGIPDWIDQLAYGLEEARSAYDDLGYDVAGFSMSHVIVAESIPLEALCSIHLCNLNGRGLNLLGTIFVPYSAHRDDPIHTARHEFFHSLQWHSMAPTEPFDMIDFIGRLAGMLADQTTDPRWWMEATAEWAAHKARDVDPGDDSEDPFTYATNLAQMLRLPERNYAYADGGFREYGAFIAAEFLEEWAGGPASFLGDGAVSPHPDIVKDTWDAIGEDAPSVEAIETSLGELEPSSSLAEALPAFTRANYLLDESGSGGTYRDADVAAWREILDESGTETEGDPDTDHEHISELARPGRHAAEVVGAYLTIQDASLEPGGSSYLEYKLPSGGRYTMLFGASDGSQLAVDVIPFSSYPSPCAAERSVDLSSNAASIVLYLPDACTAVSVLLTHIDPIEGDPVGVWVWLQSDLVTDTFERTVADGWGIADARWIWRPSHASSIAGSVDGHSARLDIDGVNGARIDVDGNISSFFAAARFSSCSDPDDTAVFDLGGPIRLSAAGVLSTAGTEPFELEDFDACEPWYIRVTGGEARVWQATASEPEVATLDLTGGVPYYVEIDTVGSGADPTHELIIDWLKVDSVPWT